MNPDQYVEAATRSEAPIDGVLRGLGIDPEGVDDDLHKVLVGGSNRQVA